MPAQCWCSHKGGDITRVIFQEPQIFSGDSQSWLLAIIIVLLVCALVTVLLLLRCCCRRGLPKRKYLSKESELHSSRPDILHPSLSFDQKMTQLTGDQLIASPTTDIYSGSGQSGSGTQSQYCEQSSNGSGNRASVNSQVRGKDISLQVTYFELTNINPIRIPCGTSRTRLAEVRVSVTWPQGSQ